MLLDGAESENRVAFGPSHNLPPSCGSQIKGKMNQVAPLFDPNFVFATLQTTCQEENDMSIIDKALEANRNYAKHYDPKLGKRPAPKS